MRLSDFTVSLTPIVRPYPLAIAHNERAIRGPYDERAARWLNRAGFEAAWAEITSWPDYAPTPLYELPGLAAKAGVARLYYKDEGVRLGLKAFKAVGGAYAVYRLLAAHVAAVSGTAPESAAALQAGAFADMLRQVTLVTASAGNHGRAVAWGARRFGCRAVVFVGATVPEARRAALAEEGAEVRIVDGSYDDAVAAAVGAADEHGWHLVLDTAYEGYTEIACDIMHGYRLIAEEVLRALGEDERPTHVFVQAGVGGLAGALCSHFWEMLEAARPRFIVVEPKTAACLFASITAGRRTAAEGPMETVMEGLAAAEPSLIAWEILRLGADDFVTIPDEASEHAMRVLAHGIDDDPPIVAGESAPAGLAALMSACARPATARALGLDANARVLVIGTEADTAPDVFEGIVGLTADEVREWAADAGG